MILPKFRRIYKTDFPEEIQDTVEKLASSINNGLEVLYDLANKKVSLKDNVLSTIKSVTVEVLSTGVPKITTDVSIDFSGRAEGVSVLKVDNLTNSSVYPSSGVTVSFTQTDNGIQINHITGLQAGYQYRLKLVIFG